MQNYRTDFDKLQWENSSNGVRSKTIKLENRRLRLLEFGKDLIHSEWCHTGHIGYVVEGEMEIEFNNETFRYQKGDGLHIPDGKQHRHRPKAKSKVVRLILVEDI